ncbi:hypothetical protein HanHA89_Chr14g0571251 [Helianthus annuus]|nr:hypothetical protein HanHA89_Chr14g0571251 [Helianthus annuus]
MERLNPGSTVIYGPTVIYGGDDLFTVVAHCFTVLLDAGRRSSSVKNRTR